MCLAARGDWGVQAGPNPRGRMPAAEDSRRGEGPGPREARNAMGTIIRHESAVEYFKEMIERALEHQRLAAGEMTAYYLVNLLAGFALSRRSPRADDQRPLGVRLLEALEQGGA